MHAGADLQVGHSTYPGCGDSDCLRQQHTSIISRISRRYRASSQSGKHLRPARRNDHGTLTVFNQTGSPTPVGCDHQWFYVALTSPEVPAPADFNDPICRPVTTLQVGETRFPVSVVASYSSCGFGAGVTTSTPECLRSARCQPAGSRCGLGMPSLPPGIYRTKFVFMGVSPSEVQRPPTITVNVQ